MVSLKEDRFLQFTISSGNKFQSLIMAGKKECLEVSVVQMGSLSDFELLIRVFLVPKCRCVSAGIATRPFNILQSRETGVLVFFLRVVSNQVGIPYLLHCRVFVVIKHKSGSSSL